MKIRTTMKIRTKLLIAIFLILALGITAVEIISYYQSKRVLEKEIFKLIRRDSQSLAQKLDSWMSMRIIELADWMGNAGHTRALLAFASDSSSRSDQGGRLVQRSSTRWGEKKRSYPFYHRILLINTEGRLVSGSEPDRKAQSWRETVWFRQAVQGENAISEPFFHPQTGDLVLAIAVPARQDGQAGGRILGVLAGMIRMDYLDKHFIRPLQVGEKGYSYVFTADGTVIFHPNTELVMKENAKNFDFSRKALEEKSGINKYWWEPDQTYKGQAFEQCQTTGWIVNVTAPLDELMRGLRSVRTYAFWGVLLVLTVLIAVVWWVVDRITGVLSQTVSHLSEIAGGDISRDVPPRLLALNDELGQMSREFQRMVEAQREKAGLTQRIAQGDLSQQLRPAKGDRLGQALEQMIQGLNRLLVQVREAAQQVALGAGQISDSSQSLSQGATEQAASFEEITSAMNEIGSRTKTNAQNASQANELADQTRQAAATGTSEMGHMVSAMDEINQAAQAIHKIINVIDEIAFQTNLLSLNAAIEAARAGRYGKGFAVVAEEVRSLASRSAKAARETAELIESAIEKVESGNAIAGQTEEALNRIVDSSTKMADLVAEIANASSEQAEGISQINAGMDQVERVTQQNTANAEQTAAAAQELSGQAEKLEDILGHFQLQHSGSPALSSPETDERRLLEKQQ